MRDALMDPPADRVTSPARRDRDIRESHAPKRDHTSRRIPLGWLTLYYAVTLAIYGSLLTFFPATREILAAPLGSLGSAADFTALGAPLTRRVGGSGLARTSRRARAYVR